MAAPAAASPQAVLWGISTGKEGSEIRAWALFCTLKHFCLHKGKLEWMCLQCLEAPQVSDGIVWTSLTQLYRICSATTVACVQYSLDPRRERGCLVLAKLRWAYSGLSEVQRDLTWKRWGLPKNSRLQAARARIKSPKSRFQNNQPKSGPFLIWLFIAYIVQSFPFQKNLL